MANIEEGIAVVTVGRSQPIPPGQATADQSLPVVVASDQSPVPVLDNLSDQVHYESCPR